MGLGLGIDVVKRHNAVILKYLGRRDHTGDDFTKDTIRIAHSGLPNTADIFPLLIFFRNDFLGFSIESERVYWI